MLILFHLKFVFAGNPQDIFEHQYIHVMIEDFETFIDTLSNNTVLMEDTKSEK